MDLAFDGSTLDPSKCTKLSMDEKRELVYKLSKCPGAPGMLQSWSRQEILQILCVEMGKERKYTGLTKLKIIEHLLKIVSGKKAGENEVTTDAETESSLAPVQRSFKRQRKTDNPLRLTVPVNCNATNNGGIDLENTVYCKNSACRATLKQGDAFCRRCSCCICYKYDDNKDPSLWLTCSSDPPFQAVACGMSCHLDCALKHENSGIGKAGHDGSFRCVACWKVNDLLGCWKKQLLMAKDTRRVDILCYRLSLSQKLLNRTGKYQKLYEIVNEALRKLEDEVGPLSGLAVKMGRGIVNRLSSGPEVQKLCALALESLDKQLLTTTPHSFPAPVIRDLNATASATVRIEDVYSTSLAVVLNSEDTSTDTVIGYNLWYRKAYETSYPAEPTCTLFVPNTRFVVTGLRPSTEYHFKAVSFNDSRREMSTCEVRCRTQDEVANCSASERSQSPTTYCSSLSNPSSVEDETNHNTLCDDHIVNRADNYHSYSKDDDKIVSMKVLNGITSRDVMVEGGTLAETVPSLEEEHTVQAPSIPSCDVQKLQNKQLHGDQTIDETSIANLSNAPVRPGLECVPHEGNLGSSLPITPSKLDMIKDGQGKHARSKSCNKDLPSGAGKGDEPKDASTSKKKNGERHEEECAHSDGDFEYYVKVIRWLECEGHIEKNFRQKFLTWYSLRATPKEMRVVKAFVDTFIQDPASLAEQLIDTFSECISARISSVVPPGFCMKLWH